MTHLQRVEAEIAKAMQLPTAEEREAALQTLARSGALQLELMARAIATATKGSRLTRPAGA